MKSSIRLAAFVAALVLAGCGEISEPTRPELKRTRPIYSQGDSTMVASDTTSRGGPLVGGN